MKIFVVFTCFVEDVVVVVVAVVVVVVVVVIWTPDPRDNKTSTFEPHNSTA